MQTEKRVECLVEGNEETALVLLDEDEGYLTFIRENGIEWRFNIEDIEEVLRVQRFIRDTINRGREKEDMEREDYEGFLNIQRAIKTGGSYHVD